jgi:predicted AlkP superfamily pyrophosphatase or phosphodiesterase
MICACTLFEDDLPDDVATTPIILISMDGFRWDYMERTETPNMDHLASVGVQAEALIPVFPSYTFPNHLSIATGCYPKNHGIISNKMWDPVFEEWYYIGEGADPVQDGKWYEAEPIWVTVEKAGLKSAIYHWPGSEAEIMGYRPSHYYVYDASVSNEEKIDQVLEWLALPPDESPQFIATYFNEANYYGHRLGVEGTALDTVIQGLDQNIGQLIAGLGQQDLLGKVNIIILADHGMVDLDVEKVVFLDDYISMQDLERFSLGPVSMLDPVEGKIDSLYAALKGAHPNLQVYKKEETPEHLHYNDHRRISPLVCIPDESWYVSTHYYFDNYGFGNGYIAAHGYEPDISSMQAIFLASGPHFNKGIRVPRFQNIHIYNLMAHILDLDGVENDGTLDSIPSMLKTP